MEKIKPAINPVYIFPSSFTYANALCGFASIFFSINSNFFIAGVLIIIAILLDVFDGRIARFFKATSEFGKELDSFADLVSFGVAPAVLIYLSELHVFGTTGLLISFLLILGGMSRLARFNVINISNYFLGIPIDASGLAVASLAISKIHLNPNIIACIVITLAFLMVCNIKYPSFKKIKREKRKKIIYLTLLFAISCIIMAVVDIEKLIIIPPAFYIIFGPILEIEKNPEEHG